jgi:hypothetical protein
MGSIFSEKLTGTRLNNKLSQKVSGIIKSSYLDSVDVPDFDPFAGIPLQDHRYNHRYPLFLHKDSRPLHVRSCKGSVSSSESQARLTSASPVVQAAPCRVCRGLDFLKVSFWLDWNKFEADFLGILDFMKKQVQETEKDCVPVFKENGFDWNLYRTGTSKYAFRLKSGDITLMFSKRKADNQIPNCRLEIGSLSCWSPGFFPIYERAKSFLSGYGAKIVKERVSEAHLAADFAGKSGFNHFPTKFSRRSQSPCLSLQPSILISRKRKWMHRLCILAGVKPFGLHSIRHLTASILSERNAP